MNNETNETKEQRRREDIVTRIQRLLALGDKNRNNSPEEAELAASMAAKLMAEHRIEQLELEAAGEEEAEPLVDLDLHEAENLKRKVSWKSYLAGAISQANGCRCVSSQRNGKKQLLVLGRVSNVQAVHYLYGYLVREVDQIAAREARGKGRAWANSFRMGMVSAIWERLDAERKAREAAFAPQTTALVKRDDQAVDDFVNRRFPRLSKSRSQFSGGGFAAGERAGNRVNLNGGKGLGAPAPKLKGR